MEDEPLKRNNHYVPQFWIKRFKADSGSLFALKLDGVVMPAGPKAIMNDDYLYTIFDDHWNPSNALEDFFSRIESDGSQLFRDIVEKQSSSEQTRVVLARFLAIQAVRHPDMRSVKSRLVSSFLSFLALSHDLSKEEFVDAFEEQGFRDIQHLAAADEIFDLVSSIPRDSIQETKEYVENLQPYDPRLPFSDVILAAWPLAEKLETMEVIVHEAPEDSFFVLGDTPIDQEQLLEGFIVPLSKNFAVEFKPTETAPKLSYIKSTRQFVESVHEDQYRMAVFNLVGPDKQMLEGIFSKFRN